jgi:ATP/ADP translocase
MTLSSAVSVASAISQHSSMVSLNGNCEYGQDTGSCLAQHAITTLNTVVAAMAVASFALHQHSSLFHNDAILKLNDMLPSSSRAMKMYHRGYNASTVTALLKIRGGGSDSSSRSSVGLLPTKSSKAPLSASSVWLGVPIRPEFHAVILMAIAMSFHYLGYSLARPISVALFTSASTGYAGFPAAFPFAMAFVSPVALLLLMGYNTVLELSGPRGALRQSTLFCAAFITLSAMTISGLENLNWMIGSIPVVKFLSGPLFVFREAYVQLLTSQYWSFMASSLTPNQSAQWFAPIAGLTSISSAVGGVAVSPLVERIGLSGVLVGTGLSLVISYFFSTAAYNVAERYGFDPSSQAISSKSHQVHVKQGKTKSTIKKSSDNSLVEIHKQSMIEKATKLFRRVPVLWALFLEILASQGLATLLNVCFVAVLGSTIPDDSQRAGWVGHYFALINVCTMLLQFGVLPRLMRFLEPRDLWRILPLVSCIFTGYQAIQPNPSLWIVSSSLLVMKVSEYSARRMLDEMIYVPLDFESRFLGKEVLGVFAYRFGKSLMSLILSAFTAIVGGGTGIQELSIFSSAVSILWIITAWKVSNLVPTRQEAQDTYQKGKKALLEERQKKRK